MSDLEAESKQLMEDIKKLKNEGDTPENRDLIAAKTLKIQEIAYLVSVPPTYK